MQLLFANAAGKTGTYTYKLTLKDNDDKEIVRTFTINVVKEAATQAYQLDMATEMDTTVKMIQQTIPDML